VFILVCAEFNFLARPEWWLRHRVQCRGNVSQICRPVPKGSSGQFTWTPLEISVLGPSS